MYDLYGRLTMETLNLILGIIASIASIWAATTSTLTYKKINKNELKGNNSIQQNGKGNSVGTYNGDKSKE